MLTKLNLCPALGDPPFVSATRGLELLEHKLHEGASASAGTLVCMRYSISDSTLATAACHSPLRPHGTRLAPSGPVLPCDRPSHSLSISPGNGQTTSLLWQTGSHGLDHVREARQTDVLSHYSRWVISVILFLISKLELTTDYQENMTISVASVDFIPVESRDSRTKPPQRG